MANRLKNALWLIVGAVVAVWALTSLVGLVRAGDMDPPGPPGGTMKTLIAVEPRTPIWGPDPGDFPIVISQPGSYYLGENINGEADKDGILIMADNVTLDLNGFTLKGADGKSSYNGITVPLDPTGVVYNLSIFNGTIRDWGNAGIAASSPNGEARNSQLRDLKVYGNGAAGVRVEEALVTGVVARLNGKDGIKVGSGQVLDSSAVHNRQNGISLGVGEVRGCMATGNVWDGIEVQSSSLVVGNVASHNSQDLQIFGGGHGIHVTGAQNRIEGNSASLNGGPGPIDSGGDGIHVTGGSNRIEGNDVQGNFLNQGPRGGHGIDSSVGSGVNLIIKNSASGNGAGNYVTHASDTVGPIETKLTPLGNPWANISY